LNQGAEDFGRCCIILESKEGDPVFVVLTRKAVRGRPRKPAGEAAQEAAGAPGANGPTALDKFAQEWQTAQLAAGPETEQLGHLLHKVPA
jgi:hypothetical protein